MQWIELFGYLGAALTFATFSMKTMLHLRIVGIAANLAFISYGALDAVYPILVLHGALLPLNAWRLRQLIRLTRQIEEASSGRMSLDWLKPFSRQRQVTQGQVLFRIGDLADELMVVIGGGFRAVEANVPLGVGAVIGELALIAKEHRRTQTVVCEQDGTLLLLSYNEVRQMYFQNPKFGFFLLELVAERLTRDTARLAEQIAAAGAPAEIGPHAA